MITSSFQIFPRIIHKSVMTRVVPILEGIPPILEGIPPQKSLFNNRYFNLLLSRVQDRRTPCPEEIPKDALSYRAVLPRKLSFVYKLPGASLFNYFFFTKHGVSEDRVSSLLSSVPPELARVGRTGLKKRKRERPIRSRTRRALVSRILRRPA